MTVPISQPSRREFLRNMVSAAGPVTAVGMAAWNIGCSAHGEAPTAMGMMSNSKATPTAPDSIPPTSTERPGAAVLACSQLGFRSGSPKTLTMAAGPSLAARLPAEIPFYVMHAGGRLPRRWATPEIWKESLYPWPFDPLTGPYARSANDLAKIAIHCGMLRRLDSRWGTFWQGDFTSFDKPGVYQIETEHQFSLPFAIDPAIYDRLVRGYLVYLRAQRSGCDVPRVRPATNTDDAVLDTDGSYVPVAGGWYDAGDLRKWMSLTAFHLEALFRCWHSGPEAFRPQIVEEIAWGNKWIHSMITPEGRLWEDVGGGVLRGAQGYDAGWWCENHPGCLADNADNRATDNVPASGDERRIRTTYNPWVPCIPQVGVLISLGFSGGRIRGRSWWAIGQGGG